LEALIQILPEETRVEGLRQQIPHLMACGFVLEIRENDFQVAGELP
jgi:hypothetical protein